MTELEFGATWVSNNDDHFDGIIAQAMITFTPIPDWAVVYVLVQDTVNVSPGNADKIFTKLGNIYGSWWVDKDLLGSDGVFVIQWESQ